MKDALPLSFGSLRRLQPFSRQFGLERGLPIDRYYIEDFLSGHASAVEGEVLEIGDDSYSRRYGDGRVVRQDILHVVPGYPGATIIGDLSNAPQIPSDSYDCIILTQTLHYIFDLTAAVRTLHRILKPGGVLLATMPGISQICRDQDDRESDCWRFTLSSARKLFAHCFGDGIMQIRSYGNVLSSIAFLEGLVAGDLTKAELDHDDRDYQLLIAVAVTKSRESA